MRRHRHSGPRHQRLPLRRRIKKSGVAALAAAAPTLYRAYMALVWATSRIDAGALEPLVAGRKAGSTALAALLHQDIFAGPYLLRHRRVLTFVSISDAGTIVTAVLERLGFCVERGGTSSRASRLVPVFSRMVQRCREQSRREGAIVVFACDGSRGPAGAVQPGVALFAMKTRARLYCVKLDARPAFYLPTWDRTMVPLPFSRIRVLVDGPIDVPAGSTRHELEDLRIRIEKSLHDLHGLAFAGRRPLPRLAGLAETARPLRPGLRRPRD